MFERAQAIRQEKAQDHPNNPGKKRSNSRSYSWGQNNRVYLLQGVMTCIHCDSPMSPHYVFHKAGGQRRTDSYISHYVCTQYRKYGSDCDHSNRILARKAEEWVFEQVKALAEDKETLERAIESARINSTGDLQHVRDTLALNRAALAQNQKEIDTIVAIITSGTVTTALIGFLNERAHQLKMQRETLLTEHRQLQKALVPLADNFDAHALHQTLADFVSFANQADPVKVQRLLRFFMWKLEWSPECKHVLHFHDLSLMLRDQEGKQEGKDESPKTKQPQPRGDQDWFDISMGSGCPLRRTYEPLIFCLNFLAGLLAQLDTFEVKGK